MVGLMRASLRRVRDVILSSLDDFSNDHSSAGVSCCGVVYFGPCEATKDTDVLRQRLLRC